MRLINWLNLRVHGYRCDWLIKSRCQGYGCDWLIESSCAETWWWRAMGGTWPPTWWTVWSRDISGTRPAQTPSGQRQRIFHSVAHPSPNFSVHVNFTKKYFQQFGDKDQECFLPVKKHNLDLIFVFLPALGCGRCAPGCTERRMRPAARRTSCSWRLPRPSRRPRGSAWWPKLSALPNR